MCIQKKIKEIQEKKRKERERFVQDSIRDRQRMIERANRDIDYEFYNYTSYIPAKIKIIKKSYMEGSDVVFKTKSEVFRGEFKKEYMKNSMGEIYQGEYNVLSNKTGDIMLVKFIWSAEVVVCLIDKRADKVETYKVMPSALKGLPLIW